ncbi:MAG: hypothetical protein GX166_12370 [Clostridiaceae bacterium]|nr:hypothetical protein [Clostridiaceae bacterium]
MTGKRIDINYERQKRRNTQRKLAAIILVILAVAIVTVMYVTGAYEKLLMYFGIKGDVYVYPVATMIDYSPKGRSASASINDTLIIADESGVTGLDIEGKWKWNHDYELYEPVLETYKDLVLLTDLGGYSVFAFDENGLLWHMVFDKGIIAAYYDEGTKHFLALHNDEDYKTCVTVYDVKNGNKPLFTRKFGAYYMTKADISSDASQMAVSGFYQEAGISTAVVAFLRMRDGEVYTTESFYDNIFPYVSYLKDNALFIASTDQIVRIVRETTASTKRDTEKVIWDRNADSTGLVCVKSFNDDYLIAAFSEINTNLVSDTTTSLIRVYDSKGETLVKIEVDGKARGIATGKDTFAVYTDHTVYLYNLKGFLISRYNLVSDIQNVSYLGTRVLFVSGQNQMAVVDMSGK